MPGDPAVKPALRTRTCRADNVDGGLGKHRAADAVEIAGRDIQQIDQPVIERPEGGDRNTHPAIDDGRLTIAEAGSEVTDHVRRNATLGSAGFQLKLPQRVPRHVPIGQHLGQASWLHQPGLIQCQQQRDQQGAVGPRFHEQMFIGDFGCLGPARVDNHKLATSTLQRLDALFHIRYGPDAAVRGQRIAADDQHQHGAVDVGDREQRIVAVHQHLHELMRNLVNRGRGEDTLCPQRLAQRRHHGRNRVIVGKRIAEIEGCRTASGFNACQPVGDFGIGLFPANRHPIFANPLDGRPQPVRIVLQVGDGGCFGTDVPT